MAKVSEPTPVFIRTAPNYLVEFPWCRTSGRSGSAYEWNNGAHAAVHSLLAALACRADKSDIGFWLKEAQRQITGAVKALEKPHARVVPCTPDRDGFVAQGRVDREAVRLICYAHQRTAAPYIEYANAVTCEAAILELGSRANKGAKTRLKMVEARYRKIGKEGE